LAIYEMAIRKGTYDAGESLFSTAVRIQSPSLPPRWLSIHCSPSSLHWCAYLPLPIERRMRIGCCKRTCPGVPITRQKFASARSRVFGSRGVSGHARLNFASALTSEWAYG